MPDKNTDRQNELLYMFNRVLVELKEEYEDDDAPVVALTQGGMIPLMAVTRARDSLFNEDGLFKFTEYNLARPGRTVAQMIDIINMDPFMDSDEWRDAVEKRKWPDRIELSDIAFWWSESDDSHGDNHVWLNDGRLVHQHFGPTYPVLMNRMTVRNAQENKLWPNRIELFDINFIGSNEREAAVYTEQGTFYATGKGSSYPWKWPNAVSVKNSWEKNRWPNRIEQDDIKFIGMYEQPDGHTYCYVYLADGEYTHSYSDKPHLSGGVYMEDNNWTRNFYEECRWPNRISMDDVVSIAPCDGGKKKCTHLYLRYDGGNLEIVSRPWVAYNADLTFSND